MFQRLQIESAQQFCHLANQTVAAPEGAEFHTVVATVAIMIAADGAFRPSAPRSRLPVAKGALAQAFLTSLHAGLSQNGCRRTSAAPSLRTPLQLPRLHCRHRFVARRARCPDPRCRHAEVPRHRTSWTVRSGRLLAGWEPCNESSSLRLTTVQTHTDQQTTSWLSLRPNPIPLTAPAHTGIVRMAAGSESALLCSHCEGVSGLLVCTADNLPGTFFVYRFEARIHAGDGVGRPPGETKAAASARHAR